MLAVCKCPEAGSRGCGGRCCKGTFAHWVLPFVRPIKIRNSGAVLLLAEELVVVVADEWCMGTRKERKVLLLFGTGEAALL